MTFQPLGSYAEFQQHGAGPATCGPNDSWSIAYGNAVLPALAGGIRAFAAEARRSCGRVYTGTTAVGCVPWLTSADIVDALLELTSSCIVVDKQAKTNPERARLLDRGTPIVSSYLPGFAEAALLDESGRVPVIGPGTPMPEAIDIGPLRVAGWRADGRGRPRPMLHAKMLVLGVTTLTDDEMVGEVWHLEPRRTWVGSANWTTAAGTHLEFGMWCDDPGLLSANLRFLLDVIRFSEPADATTTGPEPEIVDAVWAPDAEFCEYLRDYGGGYDEAEE